MIIIGIIIAIQRLLKPLDDNKAIAATGVKFGGCGKNLERTAKVITEIKNIYLFIILSYMNVKCIKLIFI
tara:strand:- start:2443 stop:2652 length:210 start_codon:yes stop_codon:yes gene_type:complete